MTAKNSHSTEQREHTPTGPADILYLYTLQTVRYIREASMTQLSGGKVFSTIKVVIKYTAGLTRANGVIKERGGGCIPLSPTNEPKTP